MSNEFFYKDEDGKKQDAELHDPILRNKTAREVAQTDAINAAIRRGVPTELAEQLYREPEDQKVS
jgi:hypothetical protein